MKILQISRLCFFASAAAALSETACSVNNFATMASQPDNSQSNLKYESGTHSVAFVTAPNEDTAKTIARGLVTNKLAACVNLVPKIISIYEWEDKIEEDSEVLMMIKTRTSRVEELTKYVRENHPYKVCEVITLPIENGNAPYLKWLGDIVKEKM